MATRFKKIISTDSHVHEPLDIWWESLHERFGDETPREVNEVNGRTGKFFFNGEEAGGFSTEFPGEGFAGVGHDPAVRVRFQEAAGIDAELFHPSTLRGVLTTKNREMVFAASQVYNDWLAEYCSYNPQRLMGLAVIPLEDVDKAVAELDRVAAKGMKAVLIPMRPAPGYPQYRETVYDPFWAKVQDMDWPVNIHISTGQYTVHPNRLPDRREIPGNLIELYNEVQIILANDFIFGGILDRFPRLKLIVNEFDISWIPMFMRHCDQVQDDFGKRSGMEPIKMKASDYMRERIYHGLIDEPFAKHNIKLIGAKQIIWGSDFPHHAAMGIDQVKLMDEDVLAGLPEADKEQIAGATAARVYGI